MPHWKDNGFILYTEPTQNIMIDTCVCFFKKISPFALQHLFFLEKNDSHNQNLAIFYYGTVSMMTNTHNKPRNNLCLFLMILLSYRLFLEQRN